MPFTYEVDHDMQRVRISARGDCRLDELVATLTSIVDAGAYSYAQRIDARGVTSLPTAEDTRRAVAFVARLRGTYGHGRTACITSTDVGFGMGRMYATLAAETDPGFMVFRSAEEADAWLGWQTESRSSESRPGW